MRWFPALARGVYTRVYFPPHKAFGKREQGSYAPVNFVPDDPATGVKNSEDPRCDEVVSRMINLEAFRRSMMTLRDEEDLENEVE